MKRECERGEFLTIGKKNVCVCRNKTKQPSKRVEPNEDCSYALLPDYYQQLRLRQTG